MTSLLLELERPLAKLNVLLASQFLLVVLLSTEMFNYWGDEGAEYDKNMTSLEARNLLFFVVAVLMQPVQYDALFGGQGSAWTAFYGIINPNAGHSIQVWSEEFDHRKGNIGRWENLDTVKHPRWERFIRWLVQCSCTAAATTVRMSAEAPSSNNHHLDVHLRLPFKASAHVPSCCRDAQVACFAKDFKLFGILIIAMVNVPFLMTSNIRNRILMAVGGFFIPTVMLIFTPVLLTFSSTALDFVLNATALTFIGSMDNGDPIRYRITSDQDRIAAGTNNDKQAKKNSTFEGVNTVELGPGHDGFGFSEGSKKAETEKAETEKAETDVHEEPN